MYWVKRMNARASFSKYPESAIPEQVIQKKRAEKPEVRKASREAALREVCPHFFFCDIAIAWWCLPGRVQLVRD